MIVSSDYNMMESSMVLLALILTVTGYSGMPPATRAGFEALGRRTDRQCPARHVRTITPGDLDYLQDGFERNLSRLDRARLAAINTADRRCAHRDGLACQTSATMGAMQTTRLVSRFASYVCAHRVP
ncbi:hypothetical protein [Sphingomonas sp. NFX23]|uniref:hypothetical protein n=1 Tax=Sphingomonas sp. NFX23 TaxID=2819532 RepID=UPI003CF67F14